MYCLSMAVCLTATAAAQTAMTLTQAKNLYKDVSKRRVSVHDPSIVYDATTKTYYIFGSHRACAQTKNLRDWTTFSSPWATATSNNAANSQAFTTPAVTTVTKGGKEYQLPAFNAMEWAARTDAAYNIDGNMWAPDVIYNPVMKKWCQYLSVNGDQWHSSIILLTADKVTGPYRYQAPVVISGFDSGSHSYKDTDLEIVTGTLSSLPARYNTWATTGIQGWPNNIDPCVFYDEEGNLWLVYGSWSGGIFMLELDEETGLRDYNVTYNVSTTSDPYFGKRIAGGYYVSGEAPYIIYVGGYYYLFVTYGGLTAKGGYVMRVFRSKKPNGPFVDAAGRNAIFSAYTMNYGKSSDNRGVKPLGAYDHWGFMSQGSGKEGELSQGHNSVIAADDGRTYLVYHTRFNNGTEGHSVRVHQMFQNKNGWLVAAPFEYNSDTLTDAGIAVKQMFTKEEIAGTYQLLVHKYDIDFKNLEVVEPVEITLTVDGKVSGQYTGTWSITEGTGYIDVKLGSTTYSGVLMLQTMDVKNIKTIAFSAMATSGVSVWAYKYHPQYALAWQLNNQKVPVTYGQWVDSDVDLDALWLGDKNVTLQWTSSHPDIIDEHGKFNGKGLKEDTNVTLVARLSTTGYYWERDYVVKVKADPDASGIEATQSTPTTGDGNIYDIKGALVNTPRMGVYIRNGKKFIER